MIARIYHGLIRLKMASVLNTHKGTSQTNAAQPPASQRYLIKEMAKKQGVTEELKATDMMRWIGLMNNIRTCADEIVLNDIVYS